MRYFICQEANSLPVLELTDAELPNIDPEKILEWKSTCKNTQENIPVIVGREFDGTPIIFDLTCAPHVLVAGNDKQIQNVKQAIIESLLFQAEHPEAIIMDLSKRNNLHIRHTIEVMINELEILISEMTCRFRLFTDSRVYELKSYNKQSEENTLPFIVVLLKWPDKANQDDYQYLTFCEKLKLLVIKSRAVGIRWIVMSHVPMSIPSTILSDLSGRLVFRQEGFDYLNLLYSDFVTLDKKEEFFLRLPDKKNLIKGITFGT